MYSRSPTQIVRANTFLTGRQRRDALEEFGFTVAHPNSRIHCNRSGKRLQLDVTIFCRDIVQAALAWDEREGQRPGVLAEKNRLLTNSPYEVLHVF
jgi:hypothetical protein